MHTVEGPWSMVLGHFEGAELADTFDLLPGVRLLEYSLSAELSADAETWTRVLLASTQALGRLVELAAEADGATVRVSPPASAIAPLNTLAADGARSLSRLVAQMSRGRPS